MANELVKTNGFDTAMMEIESTKKMCDLLMKTPHYAKMGQEGIYAIVSKAKSLGISEMDALNGSLYFVQGKVGMSTEMMAALIRQKGHSITKDPKSDGNKVILHGRRADNGDTWICDFSLDDAKRAGLLKNMYEKHPKVMIYNRAMSMLARQLFPDVIKGAGYDMSELKEIARSKEPLHESEDIKEIITSSQADEIVCLLAACPIEYQDKVLNGLRSRPDPVSSLYDLPIELYDRLKNALLLNTVKPEIKNNDEEIVDATEI